MVRPTRMRERESGMGEMPMTRNIIPVEQVFGEKAGKVWNTLQREGELTTEQISDKTNLDTEDVFGALGWLAREGKIQTIQEGNKKKFKLS
ncbi:MAG: winged helix-turn-helix domain-containing protein [Thermoplasmata archaeon]